MMNAMATVVRVEKMNASGILVFTDKACFAAAFRDVNRGDEWNCERISDVF